MTTRCCETMTNSVNLRCDEHDDPFACPDALVDFSARFEDELPAEFQDARRLTPPHRE
ncbi:DUF6980 family protein [Streptomyces sp. NPDC001348]